MRLALACRWFEADAGGVGAELFTLLARTNRQMLAPQMLTDMTQKAP